MHDAKNRPLKVGDRCLIPCVIKSLGSTPDYCNVQLETVLGRRPDGLKDSIGACNTGVLLRANDGDENADPFAPPVLST